MLGWHADTPCQHAKECNSLVNTTVHTQQQQTLGKHKQLCLLSSMQHIHKGMPGGRQRPGL